MASEEVGHADDMLSASVPLLPAKHGKLLTSCNIYDFLE